MVKISFEQYLRMQVLEKPMWVSPRPGVYLGYCISCREWKPLLNRIWVLIKGGNRGNPFKGAKPPDNCRECNFIIKECEGLSQTSSLNLLEEAVDDESLFALLNLELSIKEVWELLGLTVEQTDVNGCLPSFMA